MNLNEPLFEHWLLAERERLREQALEGLAELLTQRGAGTHERAVRTAIRLVAIAVRAERMLTIAATLKQQDHNVVDYITAACVASVHGGSAPPPERLRVSL